MKEPISTLQIWDKLIKGMKVKFYDTLDSNEHTIPPKLVFEGCVGEIREGLIYFFHNSEIFGGSGGNLNPKDEGYDYAWGLSKTAIGWALTILDENWEYNRSWLEVYG